MSDKPLLNILLLGPVEVRYKNAPIRINRRVERAILYYLAAEHRPVSRQQLIDRLWPEADQTDPRSTLRTNLSRLRSGLPDPDFLITDLDQVSLNLQRCRIDVLNFENQFQDLQERLIIYSEQRPLPAQVVQQIETALSLWRGDQFIGGEILEKYNAMLAWQRARERKLHHQRKILIHRLVRHYRVSGRLENALECLFWAKKMDPLDTATHSDILDILADLGRHEEILTFCDELEVLYEEQFGQPLPDEILKRCRHSEIQKRKGQTDPVIPWPYPPSMQVRLAGRSGELETLRRAYYSGGFLIIQGEGGSGKTRLVQELYETLHPRPTLIAAPGRPLENTLPLSPLIHSLRHDIPEALWETLPEFWAGPLSRLLPEVREIRPDLSQDPSSKPEDTHLIFHAMLNLYHRLGREKGRLLFFLDDAQWVDQTTLQALAYFLSQGLFNQAGLLIISARTEEPAPELQEMMDRFHRTQTVQVLHLDGLNRKDLSTLAGQVLSRPPDPSFIDRLHNETGGNPFISLEILRSILQQPDGIQSLRSPAPLPLPENVHALIRKRLDRLSEGARTLITCAAVLGTAFTRSLLIILSGIPEEKAAADLEVLHQRGFLAAGDLSNTAALQFAHEKIREVILLETSTIQKQTLHLRAARFLAGETQPENRAGVIATHFQEAGEIRAAFDWFLQAAEYAWSLGARDESLKTFQQAEGLFKNAPAGYFSAEDILQLYERWSEFAYQSHQTAMLRQTATKLQYLGEREDNPLLLGAAKTFMAHTHYLDHAFSEGLETIEEAIHHLSKTDHRPSLIKAYIRQGTLFLWTNRYPQAIASYQNALQKAGDGAQEEALIPAIFNARYQISLACYALGEGDHALQNAETIHDQFYHLLSPFNRIRALSALASAHLLVAQFQDCRNFALQALDLARDLGSQFIQEDLLITLARAETLSGQLDSAYVHAQLAVELGETNQHPGTVIRANCILGDIFNLIQNYSRALVHYRAGQVKKGFFRTSYHAVEDHIHLARLLVWTGEITEAREILNECLEVAETVQMKQLWAQALVISGICHILEGRMAVSEQELDQAAALVQKNSLRHEQYWVWIGQARVAMIKDEYDEAIHILRLLLSESLENNSPWTALYGTTLLSQVFKASGQEEDQEGLKLISEQIIADISRQTTIGPLQSDFNRTKARWQAGHYYP